MESKHLIRAAIAVSVVGHVALAIGVMFADARQFDAPPPQAIAIDIVKPEDVKPPADDTPHPEPTKQQDPFRLPDLTSRDKTPDSGGQTAAQKSTPQQSAAQQPSPQQQASQAATQNAAQPPPANAPQSQSQQQPAQQPPPSQQQPSQQQASAQQSPPQQQASLQPPPGAQQPPPQAQQGVGGAEPDVTVKYGVMLGLPTGDGGASAFAKADIAPLDIAAFRRHLKTCSTMPASVTSNDKVRIVMRAFFSPDGKLTGPPTLIEASASAKGPLLMQAAIKALESCQPYAMLPADKYNEWRVLDLAFTPSDFAG